MKILITIYVFILCSMSFAQDSYFLALDKPGKVNRIRFYTYDNINIKLMNEKHWVKGEIDKIENDKLIIDGKAINIDKINYVKMQRININCCVQLINSNNTKQSLKLG